MIYKIMCNTNPNATDEEKKEKKALALQLQILARKTKNERFLIKSESEGLIDNILGASPK